MCGMQLNSSQKGDTWLECILEMKNEINQLLKLQQLAKKEQITFKISRKNN